VILDIGREQDDHIRRDQFQMAGSALNPGAPANLPFIGAVEIHATLST